MVRCIMTTSLFFIFQGQKPPPTLLKRSRLPGDRKVGKREVCAGKTSRRGRLTPARRSLEISASWLLSACARAALARRVWHEQAWPRLAEALRLRLPQKPH